MKKLRIIQVVGDKSIGGASRHVLLLSQNLIKRGHTLKIIMPYGSVAKLFRLKGLDVNEVSMRSYFDRRSDTRIRQIMQEFKPDLVHCHGTYSGWLGRLAARKLPKIALVYTEHLWTKDYHFSNSIYENVHLRGLQLMDRFTDVTIAVSQSVKNFLSKNKIIPASKIIIVPNMLDPKFRKYTIYQKPKGVPPIIGSVGSINVQKGIPVLVQALKDLEHQKPELQWRCQIIGSGPMADSVKKMVSKLGLEKRIVVKERVDDIVETMRHFSYYVQASRSESFGISVIEAMSLGIAPIVTNRGALPEIVDHMATGVVVPYGRPDKLVAALMKLMDDEELRTTLGEAARCEVKRKYSCKQVTDRIEKVYYQALEKRRFKNRTYIK